MAKQLAERVGALEATAPADAVQLCRGGGERESGLGAIERKHRIGAGLRRRDGEAAGVAVKVEHARAGAQARDEAAGVALVEEPARRLSLAPVGQKARAVLGELYRA